MQNGYKDIEEYGIIGNLETCALVGNDGSIDWLCFPYLESPSVFGAILDNERGGHFSIQPVSKFHSFQAYIRSTNILKTTFNTPFGMVAVTDFMPVKGDTENKKHRAIYRKVECIEGHSRLKLDFKPRFNYAKFIPDFEVIEEGVKCNYKDESLILNTIIPFKIEDDAVKAQFDMKRKDKIWFVLQYGHHNEDSSEYDYCNGKLEVTKRYWKDWTDKSPQICALRGIWRDTIIRSGLVLKLLTNPRSGAIAAAATTSLPESVGGVRNWDYRYAWIRDSAYTIQALFHLDHVQESQDFMRWINSIIKQDSDPSEISIMYPLHKEVDTTEQILKYLSGYKQSSPVRIGNAAFNQKQLDIYGELINAIYDTARYGERISDETWKFVKKLVDYVCDVWNTKDRGIWEIRDEPRHYMHSKLMCWVAVDRGLKIAERKEPEVSFSEWGKTREDIKTAMLERGFNKEINSFVQYFDSNVIDATSVLIPQLGFLPYDDPRIQGTIDAVMENLMTDSGFVYRYKNDDGISGDEGCFALCSFWLVDSLTLSGRLEEAERIFVNVLQQISPLGLLSEEIDPQTKKQLGNFPQAFSHIGLINSALYISLAKGCQYKGPRPQGVKHRISPKNKPLKIKR
ncbi:glycoside hydrolase family 15 protein [Methanobacterium sp. ACI-7]|uniref:glycoside hydrolase family 15 protein n=1 Tax=unclassified Methanobacterium TaxID=2627676 RepID=UPI0039C159DD